MEAALGTVVIPYSEPTYWDNRFDQDHKNKPSSYTFDWHTDFETVWNLMGTFIINMSNVKARKILVLGCGNSVFTEKLFKSGYTNITNIDISAVVINQMQQRYTELEGVEFLVMDVRKMDVFLKGSFDIIIDKGTLDCLFAGYDFIRDVKMALHEIQRVLAPGGTYFCVSRKCPYDDHARHAILCTDCLEYGGVKSRLPYFKNDKQLKWRVASLPILGSADIMLYAMTKVVHQQHGGEEDDGGGGQAVNKLADKEGRMVVASRRDGNVTPAQNKQLEKAKAKSHGKKKNVSKEGGEDDDDEDDEDEDEEEAEAGGPAVANVMRATMQRSRSVGTSQVRTKNGSGKITLIEVRDVDDDGPPDVALVVPI